jgi:hypothetical protein
MQMRGKVVVALVLIAIWAVGGSVVAAFDHCAAMGAFCEAPCGASASGVTEVATSSGPVPAVALPPRPSAPLISRALPGVDPVPKSLLSA